VNFVSSPRTPDPEDWLRKLTPDEWIRAALGEIGRAEKAFADRNVRAAVAGCKRAAGMALNGALSVEAREGWGRTYVEHLVGLAKDMTAPALVRAASAVVASAEAPGGDVVLLRTPSSDAKVVEAARDVVAHAYAVVRRHDADRT
jgi:HEPN domain-containing protein